MDPRLPLILRLSRRFTPARALIFSFLGLILLGGLVLSMPGLTGPNGIDFIDALFTSTSAVCVTGLVVVDTGTAFTLPGQLVVLALIQLGGLGIMTFSVFFYTLVGRGVSLRDELAVRETFSHQSAQDVAALVRVVVVWTLIIEAAGAFGLFCFWIWDHSAGRAAYLSVFHAVSAFCNAGFSLWSDSLTGYRTHFGVNLVFIALIIAGGLGFIVLSDLTKLGRRNRFKLSLHSKIVGATTLVLVASGTLIFIALEWNNALKDLGFHHKFIVSLFQAVTPRTAGFNTVDFAHLTNTTILMTILLMFIGGSPGSTAGGIKTVTVALLVSLGLSRARGFSRVNIFKRSVPEEVVSRGLAILLVALAVIILALALLLASETGHLDHTQSRDAFVKLVFETVSAFGTVGLSMGITPELTPLGKFIIILTMFVGRVGPLTVAMALLSRARRPRAYNYGAEKVMVG